MKLKYVTFISQTQAEHIDPRDDMALISISEPINGKNFRLMPNITYPWKHIIKLKFHDIDTVKNTSRLLAENDEYTHFGIQHAQEIIEFVESIKDQVVSIVVHCHAGLSRSAAVAMFLAETYGLNMAPGHSTLYNRLVYSTLTNLWNQMYKMTKGGIEHGNSD